MGCDRFDSETPEKIDQSLLTSSPTMFDFDFVSSRA